MPNEPSSDTTTDLKAYVAGWNEGLDCAIEEIEISGTWKLGLLTWLSRKWLVKKIQAHKLRQP